MFRKLFRKKPRTRLILDKYGLTKEESLIINEIFERKRDREFKKSEEDKLKFNSLVSNKLNDNNTYNKIKDKIHELPEFIKKKSYIGDKTPRKERYESRTFQAKVLSTKLKYLKNGEAIVYTVKEFMDIFNVKKDLKVARRNLVYLMRNKFGSKKFKCFIDEDMGKVYMWENKTQENS